MEYQSMAGGTNHKSPCLILYKSKKHEFSEKMQVSLSLVSYLPELKKKKEARKVDYRIYFKCKVLCHEQCTKISQHNEPHEMTYHNKKSQQMRQ